MDDHMLGSLFDSCVNLSTAAKRYNMWTGGLREPLPFFHFKVTKYKGARANKTRETRNHFAGALPPGRSLEYGSAETTYTRRGAKRPIRLKQKRILGVK